MNRIVNPNDKPSRYPDPRIVGAKKITDDPPHVLDRNSKTGQPEPVVQQHEEIVISGQNEIRRPKKEKGEPEVRLRLADRREWERVKRGET